MLDARRLGMKTSDEWIKLGNGWEHIQSDAIKEIQSDALNHAADICRKYAHSGQNVYRRQVAYACENRIRSEIVNYQKRSSDIALCDELIKRVSERLSENITSTYDERIRDYLYEIGKLLIQRGLADAK